jgi:tight adherence protein B
VNHSVVVLAVIGVFLLLEGAWYLVQSAGDRKRAELKRRLTNLANDATPASEGPQILRNRRLSDAPALDSFLRGFDSANRLEALLDQTELEWNVAQVLGFSALGFFLPLLYFFLFKGALLSGILVGGIGAVVPFWLVLRARSKRVEQVSAQLPEALEMMSRSLRAGHSIQGAFQLVAKELPSPIATEFGKCYEEQKLGKSIDEATQNMVVRVPGNLDLKIFSVMIAIQRETGGNMIELLEGIAGTIRERYNFYGKLRVITAEGRAAAMILCSLPFLVVLALMVLNPEYLGLLINDPIGQIFLGMGVVSMALGIFVMNRMIQIEV